jgi:pyruvyltransferase
MVKSFKYYFKYFKYKSSICLAWDKGTNFGDAINPILINKLFNCKVMWVDYKYFPFKYLVGIGSVLQKANKNSFIWGTGFISDSSICYEKPFKIFAVRGPKTRKKLLELGIDCPEVYGDPALLLPKIYTPKVSKKYKLGIIPHYMDMQNKVLDKFKENDSILIIDIKNPNHFQFIDLLYSCEKIASSSLHGLIVADAYGIPSLWIELSNKVKGNGFKFLDYFESVGRMEKESFKLKENVLFEDIFNQFREYKIKIDLDKLINSFPYKNCQQ